MALIAANVITNANTRVFSTKNNYVQQEEAVVICIKGNDKKIKT